MLNIGTLDCSSACGPVQHFILLRYLNKKKKTKRQLGRILITRDLTSVMSLISYKFNPKHHLYSGYGDVEIKWRCLCSGTYLRAEYNNNNIIISYFNNTARNGNDENTSTKTLNI